ncbi:MAG: hypothetical protein ACR2HP_06125 [Ilumatobacteraceae bacterium]
MPSSPTPSRRPLERAIRGGRNGFRRGPQQWFRRLAPFLPASLVEHATRAKGRLAGRVAVDDVGTVADEPFVPDLTGVFDARWYETQAGDLGDATAVEHYLVSGARAGLSVSAAHAALIAGERPTTTPELADEVATLTTAHGAQELPVSMLADLPVELVTFDLWDTRVRRTRPADCAKVATVRRLWLAVGAPAAPTVWDLYRQRVATEAALAAGSEMEDYEAHDVLATVAAAAGVPADDVKSMVDQLVIAETADERACTVANAPVASLVERFAVRPEPPAVMVLSDFYLGRNELASILHEHHIEIPADRVLSSCEIGASKRLGTAYDVARRRSGFDRPRHLHVGDHAVVDGERAVEHGADAAIVPTVLNGMPGPGQLDPTSYDRLPARAADMATALHRASGSAARMPLMERHAHSAGAQMSVLAVAHVAAALETAVRHGVDVIHYLSREGAFLARVHREVADLLIGGRAPRPVHLEVSRRSTFAPSLTNLAPRSLSRLWRQYADQSMRAMLTSLGVDPLDLAGELAGSGLDLDTPVSDVARSDHVRSFLERPRVQDAVLGRAREQRLLLDEYLDGRQFGPERAVVVDVGWRGTIQDNLCLVRPNCLIHGVYLGLFPFLNPQPPNARKSAVVFDGNRAEPFGHADPPAVIEAPFTALVPSPVGYRRHGDGVVAELQVEHDRADRLVEAFQSGLLAVAPQVADLLVRWGASADLLRGGLLQFVQTLYVDPPDGLADIWFESAHDDTFGVLNVTPYAKQPPPLELLGEPAPAAQRPEAIASRWPAGYARWLPVRALALLGGLVRGDEP